MGIFCKKDKFIITTGGTGGHIFPAMRIANYLIENRKHVTFITDSRFKKFENHFVDEAFFKGDNFKIHYLPISNYRSSILRFLWTFFVSLVSCVAIIVKSRSSKIIGFGGYVSFIPLFISLFLCRTIYLHEQNSVVGRVNAIFSLFARRIFTTFPNTKGLTLSASKKALCTGLPIYVKSKYRAETYRVIENISQKQKINIIITGGSQGAQLFSKIIPGAIYDLVSSHMGRKFHVWYQAKDAEDAANATILFEKIPNLTFNIQCFFENIPEILNFADIAIIRGGAASIYEVAMFRVFPIVIPISNSIKNHQVLNASFLMEANAGYLVGESDITSHKLSSIIRGIISDPISFYRVTENLKKIFKSNPSQDIYSEITK